MSELGIRRNLFISRDTVECWGQGTSGAHLHHVRREVLHVHPALGVLLQLQLVLRVLGEQVAHLKGRRWAGGEEGRGGEGGGLPANRAQAPSP